MFPSPFIIVFNFSKFLSLILCILCANSAFNWPIEISEIQYLSIVINELVRGHWNCLPKLRHLLGILRSVPSVLSKHVVG
jgi:hypothetical protein